MSPNEQHSISHARRSRWLWPLILLVLMFAAGVGTTIWAWPKFVAWWSPPTSSRADVASQPSVSSADPLPAAKSIAPVDPALMDLRLAELNDRLTRITVDAEAASGNAARAEGLLVAFAARRALDSGTPLGYIEGQLRLRFGQAQPRAVATIINASREPVTLFDLEGGLEELAPDLKGDATNENWWTAFKREARELVIVRKADTPSPQPDKQIDRARRYLKSGRVNEALAEVEAMPGRDAAEKWVQMARRYREARRALDVVETAALLEPRAMRTSTGEVTTRQSPLAP